MRAAGVVGVSRGKGIRMTLPRGGAQPASDLVQNKFAAERPNQLWVADIAYIAIWTWFLFVVGVLDVFTRRVVVWSMADDLRTQLVLDALEMALSHRRLQGVIHRSEQRSQYTSIAFGQRCREAGVRRSTGSVGDCFDNALCESFFVTLECELLDRHRLRSQAEARMALFAPFGGWYNPRRRHSSIQYLSPALYERRFQEARETQSPKLST